MFEKLTRRDFLKVIKRVLAATGLTAVLGPIVAYFYPPTLEEMSPEPVRVASQDSIAVGESVSVPFGRYPALVIHTSQGLRAYSAVCTHFACIVQWNPETGRIECPCHAGYYDPLDGHVISGPPPAPLEALTVETVNGMIFVKPGDEI